MAKEDTSPGLLSKMVRFVRNPATNWSELDAKDTDREDAVGKLHLKEMIERKRRNDFVRKREFDMLRKLRKRESLAGQSSAAKPSFFQTSAPSKPYDKAKTLKKIDEIEAQMSMQWWKTKQGDSVPDSPSLSSEDFARGLGSAGQHGELPQQSAGQRINPPDQALFGQDGITEPSPLQSLSVADASLSGAKALPDIGGRPALSFQVDTPKAGPPMDTRRREPAVAPPLIAARPAGAARFAAGSYEVGVSGFTPTNMMAMDVLEVAHDAELEEASIRYANGDDAGAEAGLLDMLADGSARVEQPETWMVLFDLYRATDQQDKFEAAAIEFVQRFDRSAPQWFSLPELVKQMVGPTTSAPATGLQADWVCPSQVGTQTVAALKVALAKAAMPWRLDWSNLKTIDEPALGALHNLFAGWSQQPVQLRFLGDTKLQEVLQKNTPSSNRGTAQAWWQLRMEALRITRKPDEFELAALDFCVTYEVSPPSWENALCDYQSIDSQILAGGASTIIGEVFRDAEVSGFPALDGDSTLGSHFAQLGSVVAVELSGQIEGDAAEMLAVLQAKLLGADNMVISCAKLIRVDFSAAGTLLNWVSARQDEGRSVHFFDVNRLVASFFNVIGITEHAQVSTRAD